MADYNCNACSDLREDAPSLIVNGLGSTEIASLKNNTGLNPSSGNDDCTDLNNMNDCLIGNMEDEIDSYDTCEWKDFMKNFIDNLWTVLKAIIASICGIWTRFAAIWSEINAIKAKIRELCNMIDYQSTPPVTPYGSLVNDTSSSHYGGTIATKGGNAVFIPIAEPVPSALEKNVGVGIRYGKTQTERCSDGACQIVEWLAPHFYGMRVNPDVELAWNDQMWSVDKATVLGWGVTTDTWDKLAVVPIAWSSDYIALGTALFGVRLSIESNRLVLRYYGQIGADSNADISGKRIDNPRDGAETMYKTTNC